MNRAVRAAVVQDGSVLFDTRATVDKAIGLAERAAAEGARLVVFPEAFIGGYPKGVDFGARIGSRSDAGRALFERYFLGAINVPGPETERLAALAQALSLHIVIGVIERAGATLYCTALTFSSTGALVARHRKLMPTAMERLIWGMGDGSTMRVARTELGVIGAAICWENYMPLYRAHLYGQGVELYCAPTVDDRDVWPAAMRMIAVEGRCFVLSACQHLSRSDAPSDYAPIQGDDPNTTLIRGGSLIASPMGELLAGPVYETDAILTAELDMGLIPRGKFDLDVAGHYARPDVLRLLVDESEKPFQQQAATLHNAGEN